MLKCDCASNRSHIPSSLRVNTDRGLRRSFAAFSIIFWPAGCGFAQKPLVSISGFLVYYGFENPARRASEPRIGRSQFQGWPGGVIPHDECSPLGLLVSSEAYASDEPIGVFDWQCC